MTKSAIVQLTSGGEPVRVGEMHIYPIARSYIVNLPAVKGGIVWNRPLAVIVEDSRGKRQIIPVHDQTRRLQVAFLAAGLIGAFLTWAIFRRSK